MATSPHTHSIVTGIIWRDGYKANPTASNLLKTDHPFLSQEGLICSYGNTCYCGEELKTSMLTCNFYENNVLRPPNPVFGMYAHHYGNELHRHSFHMVEQVQYYTSLLNVLSQSHFTTMICSNALQPFVESLYGNFHESFDIEEVLSNRFLGVSISDSAMKTHDNLNNPKIEGQFRREATLESDLESPDGIINSSGTPFQESEINPFVTPIQETSPGLEKSELVPGTIMTRAHLSP